MTIFIAHGALNAEEHHNIIVPREELENMINHIENEDLYGALGSSRQTGKTTILYQIQKRLHGEGYGVVYLDFSGLRNHSEVDFYAEICQNIRHQLTDFINDSNNILPTSQTISDQGDFSRYLKSLSACTPRVRKLVLILDEIGGIPQEIYLSFFLNLRSFFHEGRRVSLERDFYRKFIFVFAGAIDLKRLMEGQNSPLVNICKKFTLHDFSYDQVLDLSQNFQGFSHEKIKIIVDSVYQWCDGHPYLTQRLYGLIDESQMCRNIDFDRLSEVISQLIENHLIYDNDVNLGHIRHYLEQKNSSCHNSVTQILYKDPRKQIRSINDEEDLILIGIIKRLNSQGLIIRNKIYEKALKDFFEQRKISDSRPSKPDKNNNPWLAGSFYLFGLLVIVTALVIAYHYVGLLALPLVIIGALLTIAIIGVLQALNNGTLSEQGFLQVIVESYKRLPLLILRKNEPPN